MGFKNHAQRKAVWASRNEKKGSPAKNTKHKTLFGAEVELKDGDKAMRFIDPRKGKANYEQVFKPAVKGLVSGVTKMFKDTQKLGRTGPMIPENRMMKRDAVADPIQHSKKSPMNHCASDMMHSGGWQEMRKHNSPGTIGNKAGIKHNEKMRQEIGTFKMPHSPLNNNDSIAKAWKDFKAGYMNRKTHPATGKPITAEENLAEYNREKGEFYYDHDKKKLRLIPTDDGEQKIMKGIEKNQLAPDRKSSMSPLNKEGKKDACYHKVKSRVKVWPSAYASGQLVQCRKAGAANWGNKSKKK